MEDEYFESDEFTDELFDDSEELIIDEYTCSECKETFLLNSAIKAPEKCPFCGTQFD